MANPDRRLVLLLRGAAVHYLPIVLLIAFLGPFARLDSRWARSPLDRPGSGGSQAAFEGA
jgi:hypothetical protein